MPNKSHKIAKRQAMLRNRKKKSTKSHPDQPHVSNIPTETVVEPTDIDVPQVKHEIQPAKRATVTKVSTRQIPVGHELKRIGLVCTTLIIVLTVVSILIQ